MFFEIADNGAIMICAEEQVFPHLVELTPPVEFDAEEMHDWKVVDGLFVYDPIPEKEPSPTLKTRVEDVEEKTGELEEALELILSGVTE